MKFKLHFDLPFPGHRELHIDLYPAPGLLPVPGLVPTFASLSHADKAFALPQTTAVPEPSSAVLLVVGIAGIAARRLFSRELGA